MKSKKLGQYLFFSALISAQVFASDTKTTVTEHKTIHQTRSNSPKKLNSDHQAKGTAEDVEITRQIREDITNGSNLSMNAKNVKIISLKNDLTLQGVVETPAEKNRIYEIAQKHIKHSQVIHNQLEVQNL